MNAKSSASAIVRLTLLIVGILLPLIPSFTAVKSAQGEQKKVVNLLVSKGDFDGLVAPPPAEALFYPQSAPKSVIISGVKQRAPSSGRPGVYLPLSKTAESSLSGKAIRISVTARRPQESKNSEFAVAYSTNEVGNSGWRKFKLTSNSETYSFVYSVPTMKNGGGDFLGFLPDPSGGGGKVEILKVSIEAIGQSSIY